MTYLRRIDGLDWNEVKRQGFKHVNGAIYDVDPKQAAKLVEEQPQHWAKATAQDIGALGKRSEKPKAAVAPASGTISSENNPELTGGGTDELKEVEPDSGLTSVETFVDDDAEIETKDEDVLQDEPEIEGEAVEEERVAVEGDTAASAEDDDEDEDEDDDE